MNVRSAVAQTVAAQIPAARTLAANSVAVRKQRTGQFARLNARSRAALLNKAASAVVYQHDNGEQRHVHFDPRLHPRFF